MMKQPGQQAIVIHIFPNISRSKGNQTIKFGQLIECNMRNLFLEKIKHKMWWRNQSETLSEKLKLGVSLDQQSKVLYGLFLLYAKLRASDYFWQLKDL